MLAEIMKKTKHLIINFMATRGSAQKLQQY